VLLLNKCLLLFILLMTQSRNFWIYSRTVLKMGSQVGEAKCVLWIHNMKPVIFVQFIRINCLRRLAAFSKEIALGNKCL
jgi:hypothetical protein